MKNFNMNTLIHFANITFIQGKIYGLKITPRFTQH